MSKKIKSVITHSYSGWNLPCSLWIKCVSLWIRCVNNGSAETKYGLEYGQSVTWTDLWKMIGFHSCLSRRQSPVQLKRQTFGTNSQCIMNGKKFLNSTSNSRTCFGTLHLVNCTWPAWSLAYEIFSDVKWGQILESEAEEKPSRQRTRPKTIIPRPRTIFQDQRSTLILLGLRHKQSSTSMSHPYCHLSSTHHHHQS